MIVSRMLRNAFSARLANLESQDVASLAAQVEALALQVSDLSDQVEALEGQEVSVSTLPPNRLEVDMEFNFDPKGAHGNHIFAVVTGLVKVVVVPVIVSELSTWASPPTATIALANFGTTPVEVDAGLAGQMLGEAGWVNFVEGDGHAAYTSEDLLYAVDDGNEGIGNGIGAGHLRFIIFWEPVSEGATLVAGDGSAP